MESVYTYTIFFILFGTLALPYWIRVARQQRLAQEKFAKNQHAESLIPVTLHPHIDLDLCIGCGSCVKVCPENVLGIVGGRSAIISGLKCVGHALCAEVCPVEAITMGFGTPKEGQEIPFYNDSFESNVPGLFIVGELGGIGLIKNAVSHGIKAVNAIVKRPRTSSLEYDVIIIGAGPAGLTAALACIQHQLRYIILEQDSVGGTIAHYPRQKLVLTSPVELPLYGRLKVSEISKEELLDIWLNIVKKFSIQISSGTPVQTVEKGEHGFSVKAGERTWQTEHVLLAIGRRGSPRKLGVSGEERSKVTYRLIEAEAYQQKHILVVGGGDSAIEAAVALARQRGNVVTISYRKGEFSRLKEKNEKSINDLQHSGKIKVLFNSQVVTIAEREIVLKNGTSGTQTLQNDHVFVFAGGELPTALLKKAGIAMRTQGGISAN